MKKQTSFAKIDQNIRQFFRQNLNTAESDEDVKKFFVYAVQDLIKQALAGKVIVEYTDVLLDQEKKEGFALDENLKQNEEFMEAWGNSDLKSIIQRFAEAAIKHLKHLDKHRDKTETKMYPTPSHAGWKFTNPPSKKKR